MATTTIRIPEELKERVAAAAKDAGTTPHSFILAAIAEKAETAERRAAFDLEAQQRLATILANGETIPWSDMRHYLLERAKGQPTGRPKARKLGQ